MGQWNSAISGAFQAVRRAARRLGTGKVKATPFGQKDGEAPFNASGVAQVGPRRFVFIDNHEPGAFFELALDGNDALAERIQRRPFAGVTGAELRDLEGLTRIDVGGDILLFASSSLCVTGTTRSDGLVRARYTPHGELQAETMTGFRAWLLAHEPSLAIAGLREPDKGGLNIEGLAWDPREGTLVMGLRGPADRGRLTVIRIPADVTGPHWTTSSLGPPSLEHLGIPRPHGTPGIRDISYDEDRGDFLILIGRSTSDGDEPFQLCRWDGSSDDVTMLDAAFHRSMKPEGITTFSAGEEKRILIVDDGGGYAVSDYPDLEK